MSIRRVVGPEKLTKLYSKDRNLDVGQLVEDLVLGDKVGENTVTIGKDGSLTVTGSATLSSLLLAEKTPAAADAPGTKGEIAWDADYIYVCVATDTWVRAALTTWGA